MSTLSVFQASSWHTLNIICTTPVPNTDKLHSSTHKPLYSLWVALTTMTWFQALFTLSAAFLHFYLFFILHIPFSHLVDTRQTRTTDGSSLRGSDSTHDHQHNQGGPEQDEDQVQKEVDIRARCERAPFEEYIWVWWAWWAFRRSPVTHIYALTVGSLSLATVCWAETLGEGLRSNDHRLAWGSNSVKRPPVLLCQAVSVLGESNLVLLWF